MNLFDIMGPIMVGPSSSHTAGAARIGRITRRLLGEPPVSAQLLLHGSFAATGAGHGTDRALVAGLLGMRPDDPRLPRSFELAKEAGMDLALGKTVLRGAHPNTVLLRVKGGSGREMEVVASSLGGGRVKVCSRATPRSRWSSSNTACHRGVVRAAANSPSTDENAMAHSSPSRSR